MTLTTLQLSEAGRTVTLHDGGAGAPLVLLHGVGMQSAAWAPQIEDLSRSHRVIALDLPGHGGSDPLPVGSDLPDFVAWLQDVVRALDLGPVNLAGHSMGALIAAGFAASHPALTQRVALLNGVFCRTAEARAAVLARAAEIDAGPVDLATPLARWFGDSATDLLARDQVADWLRAVDPAGYATAYGAFARGDATYADQLVDIACPFLAITGDGDPNSTPAMAQAMAARVQMGRAIVIPGHRHMVNLTAPDVVAAHLRDWLATPFEEGPS
ncbi:alpha/beta fold hydrolase [Phaeobacter gallaeciensis]|uniref:Hydrolase or acyltransferase (Alpha/beta hydrolase superfamily) n=1 Tax=Phaeobacter gallaeciensis TaxID=60890 RepID=A0AAC9Z8G2_9RHOB|nr:alpha/beta fold hydrolase [Phaeobacter gallaeciensis]AHD09060.1 putative hydrolase or acyltransferase (alpha/beta hydrolase superfamily) [Phaeobacter gallaeciensis DSM 26640]ATE92326.1 putative hydrolase or acyltransferase (alpha/beta hydrolase superfamily) [Phaeobacter gallaeciensis]ATE97855.1 putative hydrolase or acyltransferase (alpha/beta hydrolase superfamily) [Phaeobacter gallaeciensis]ATF00988.1 putative hydrolase or acyltransferase (alpha/beta hydrolase superfamily) [Phaeobacter gal